MGHSPRPGTFDDCHACPVNGPSIRAFFLGYLSKFLGSRVGIRRRPRTLNRFFPTQIFQPMNRTTKPEQHAHKSSQPRSMAERSRYPCLFLVGALHLSALRRVPRLRATAGCWSRRVGSKGRAFRLPVSADLVGFGRIQPFHPPPPTHRHPHPL
jgi:hypothetical protein